MPASEAERVRRILLPCEAHASGDAAFQLMLCLAHCGPGDGDGPLRIWAEGLFSQVTYDQTPYEWLQGGNSPVGIIALLRRSGRSARV
jgi:hypothetical protein